jgi:hypothetical protein
MFVFHLKAWVYFASLTATITLIICPKISISQFVKMFCNLTLIISQKLINISKITKLRKIYKMARKDMELYAKI